MHDARVVDLEGAVISDFIVVSGSAWNSPCRAALLARSFFRTLSYQVNVPPHRDGLPPKSEPSIIVLVLRENYVLFQVILSLSRRSAG